MRPAQICALVLAGTVTLVGCAGNGVARSSGVIALVPIRTAPTPTGWVDSVSCVSGAAALDAAPRHVVPARGRKPFLPRWGDGANRTVTVRIDNPSGLKGWSPSDRNEVVSALSAWEGTGAPVAFALVGAGSHADVTVHWIDKFNARYEGWTTVSWNRAGWLINGDVTLALRSPTGQLLTPRERGQVATHEVGHVLGLSHSGSDASIMSPRVKVTEIEPVDVVALRALYAPRDSSEFSTSPARRGPIGADHCAARKSD